MDNNESSILDPEKFPTVGQGIAKKIADFGEDEETPIRIYDRDTYEKDTETGFTNPNLHRRINPQEPEEYITNINCVCNCPYIKENGPINDCCKYKTQLNPEREPKNYTLGIYGNNSYRTIEIVTHIDEELEESEEREIP